MIWYKIKQKNCCHTQKSSMLLWASVEYRDNESKEKLLIIARKDTSADLMAHQFMLPEGKAGISISMSPQNI